MSILTTQRDTVLVNMLSLRQSRAGGAETFGLRLVSALSEAWDGDVRVLVRHDTAGWLTDRDWVSGSLVPVKALGHGSASVPATNLLAARRVAASGAIVLSPFNIHTLGCRPEREVITVQDLISFHYLAGLWGPLAPIERAVYEVKARLLARSIRRAAAVVVHLEATREDLHRWVPGVDPSRVHVVYLGAGNAHPGPVPDVSESTGDRPYVLVVGSSDAPHKNLGVVLEMARTEVFRATGAEVVMVGRTVPPIPGDLHGTVRTEVDVSDETVARLYRNCACLVVPSAIEGFGFPVIEGFAHGAPCVVSDIPAFRETGGDYVRYFDPSSAEDLAEIVAGVIGDDDWATDARHRGPGRAAKFTWEACGQGYAAVLRSVADSASFR